MRKALAALLAFFAIALLGGTAQAGWRHAPRCPAVFYWHLSPVSYRQWSSFGLFNGSWGEKHRVVRRYRHDGVLVKVWRPPYRCWYAR